MVWLVGIIAAGAWLRLRAIDLYPLWFDEAITLSIAQWPVRTLLLDPVDQSPGLYYLLVKLLDPGADPLAARSLSVLFGCLTIVAVYGLARSALRRVASLCAAAIIALSAHLIDFSQEGRPYALVVLLLTVASIGLVRWLGSAAGAPRRIGWLAVFVIAGVLACYGHFIGLLCTGLLCVAALPLADRSDRRSKWTYRGALLMMALAIVPEYFRSVARAGIAGEMGWLAADSPVAFLGGWADVTLPTSLLATPWENSGVTGAILFVAVVGVAVAIILRSPVGRAWLVTNRAFVVAGLVLFLFPLVLWLFSVVVTPVLMPRTALPGSVGMALLLGSAVDRGPGWKLGAPIVALFAAALLISGTMRPRDPWDRIGRYLVENVGPDDMVAVCPDWQAAALLHQYGGNGRPFLLVYPQSIALLPSTDRSRAAVHYYHAILKPSLAAVMGRTAPPTDVVIPISRRLWVVGEACRSTATRRLLAGAEERTMFRTSDSRLNVRLIEPRTRTVTVRVVRPSSPPLPAPRP
jgi:4-amino-4-deoxy-L-arabinose transferase-like glycosyltransferase